MNALILAAGLGTRLGTYTQDRPKALVRIEGHTMLELQLLHLASIGFDQFVINTHHFSNLIRSYLAENSNFGLDIRLSDESEILLNTGGGIRQAMRMFKNGSPILVHNVDIFSDTNLTDLYQRHINDKSMATLLISERKTSRYLYFNEEKRLIGWSNTKTGQERSPYSDFQSSKHRPFAFQGVHVISHDILSYLDKVSESSFSITDFYVDTCKELSISGTVSESSVWVDAGRPESLPDASEIIRSHYLNID